ncbi:GAF domain-containing protein [Streptomyces sp. SGAir0957]
MRRGCRLPRTRGWTVSRLVAELLDVPVALVSLVVEGEQFFPGMIGLKEPWASLRRTPLTHSMCQHVVADEEPFTVADARAEARTRDSAAIEDLGVVGYAGMPLTDTEGRVLGALCAIDTSRGSGAPGSCGRSRTWRQRVRRNCGCGWCRASVSRRGPRPVSWRAAADRAGSVAVAAAFRGRAGRHHRPGRGASAGTRPGQR